MSTETKKIWRPTKYKEELCDQAQVYIDQTTDQEIEFHKTRGEKSDSYERYTKCNLPTVEGFAKFLDVNQDTIVERAKEYPKFSVALQKVKTEQKKRLLEKSLDWTYNPTIAKLILSHNHWMRETTISENKNETMNYNVDVTTMTAAEIEEQRKKFLS